MQVGGQVRVDPKTGEVSPNRSGHQVVNPDSDLQQSQAHVRDNYLASQNQGGTPAENAIRGSFASPSPSDLPAGGSPTSRPKRQPLGPGQSRIKEAHKYNSIEELQEDMRKLNTEIRKMQDQGRDPKTDPYYRSIIDRTWALDDRLKKLKSDAAIMPDDERQRRSALDPSDPDYVMVIPPQTRPMVRTTDGMMPSLHPTIPTNMPEQAVFDPVANMQAYDYNKDGVLDQAEIELWDKGRQSREESLQKLKSGKATRHGSGTEPLTPPGQMPGYSLGGTPSSPLYGYGEGFGPGQTHGHGGHGGHGPAVPTDETVAGASINPRMPGFGEYYDNPQDYSVPAFPGESISSFQQQGVNNIVKLIETGKRSYQEVMGDPNLPSNIKEQIAQLDSNGDGKLSKREMKNSDFIHTRMENATRPGSGGDRNGLLARIRANRQQRRGN